MSENNQNRIVEKTAGNMPAEIFLGQNTSIDISWLPEPESKALLKDYTKGILDIDLKAKMLHVEAAALKKNLCDLSDTVREVSDSGNSVTISHVNTTDIGRTEVVMGNTDQAHSGKLTKSQTGEKDWNPYYIFACILALVIIFALSG